MPEDWNHQDCGVLTLQVESLKGVDVRGFYLVFAAVNWTQRQSFYLLGRHIEAT